MKRIHFLMLAVLTLAASSCFLATPVQAWEFELAGSFNWSYEWYNQRGSKGFLGPYNVDNGAGTRAANLN
ncbi:MAG: hypothetical protein AB1733_17115, partial [Thermodesulfobacteriota bacterium]